MTVFGFPTASSENSADYARMFFIDDDEETLASLISDQDHELSDTAVISFVSRFVEDHSGQRNENTQQSSWESWFRRVQSMGFSIVCSESGTTPIATSPDSSTSLPQAFESDNGKLHINATSSILSVSKVKAVQLTLAFMRSVTDIVSLGGTPDENSNDQFEVLLGTRTLVERVVEYYYKQRVARISVLSECLRLEKRQDDDDDKSNSNSTRIVTILDSIDGRFKIHDRNRALFKILLTIICQSEASLSWAQFLPAEQLQGSSTNLNMTINPRNGFGGDSTDRVEWKLFMRNAMHREKLYLQRERAEALEALLVLLYSRIEEGVKRLDLAILLVAFDAQNFFEPKPQDSLSSVDMADETTRIRSLIGVMFIESMSLWRIFDNSGSVQGKAWVELHPLLEDNGCGPNVLEQELQTLSNFIDRTCNEKGSIGLPQSLALLAFGILLHTAGRTLDAFSTLARTGTDLASRANSEWDAFGYLQRVMDNLVVPIPQLDATFVLNRCLPPDLRAFEEDRLVVANGQAPELRGPSLLYASIGRELLSAAIHAFQPALLPDRVIPDRENMKLLSSLVSAIYRNSPTICERFWADWENYLQSNVATPLCMLLIGSHKLASAVLSGRTSDEESMLSIMPFFCIVASLSYCPETVERSVGMMPDRLINFTLHILSSRSSLMCKSEQYESCRESILESLSTLAKVGNSSVCRSVLRSAMAETNGESSTSGLQSLFQLVAALANNNYQGSKKIFTFVSELLTDAPFEWVCDVVSGLKFLQGATGVWNCLFRREDSAIRAIVKLINGVVIQSGKILFHTSCSEESALEILSFMRSNVHAINTILLGSISKTTWRFGTTVPLSYCTSAAALECLTNIMMNLTPIIDLHLSKVVQEDAFEIRATLINALASSNGLGEAVFLYAVAPNSLTLALNLENVSIDASILSIMSKHSKNDVLNQGDRSATSVDLRTIPSICATILSSNETNDFDFERIRSRGWQLDDDDTESCLHGAFTAIRFLNCWSKTVDVMMKSIESSSETDDRLLMLSPHSFLCQAAILPREVLTDSRIAHLCSHIDVSNFSLLCVYLKRKEIDGVGFESLVTMEVFDFLTISLAHGRRQLNGRTALSDDPLFRCLYKSSFFIENVRTRLSDAFVFERIESPSMVDKFKAAIGLRSLRTLAAYFSGNPLFAAKALRLEGGSLVKLFSEGLANAARIIDVKTSSDRSAQWWCLCQLRAAIGGLNILSTIWKHSRSSSNSGVDYWQRFTNDHSRIVTDIACFVFKNLGACDASPNIDYFSVRYRCLVLSTMSISLDFLSHEISWTNAMERIPSDLAIVVALGKALDQSLSRVLHSVKCFCQMSNFRLCGVIFNLISGDTGTVQFDLAAINSILMYFDSTYTFKESDGCVEEKESDGTSLALSLWQSRSDYTHLYDSTVFASNAESLYNLFSNETHCLVAWKVFTHSVFVLSKKWGQQSSSSISSSFPDWSGNFSSSMTKEVLMVTYENLLSLKSEMSHGCPYLLRKGVLSSTNHATGLLLTILRKMDSPMAGSDWITSIDLICKIVEILYAIDEIDHLMLYTALKQLFTVAIILLRVDRQDLAVSDAISKGGRSLFLLASRSCKVIASISNSSFETTEHQSCYGSCVTFLTSVIESYERIELPSNTNENVFVSKLCQEFQELDVIRSVINHASAMRLGAEGRSDLSEHSKTWNDDESSGFFVSMNFLTRLAATGYYDTLLLLASSNASQVLWMRNGQPLLHDVTRNDIVADGLIIDEPTRIPSHVRAKMHFIASFLRSLNSFNQRSDMLRNASAHFMSAAVEFIRIHRQPFLASLERCCASMPGKQTILSGQILDDADAVLSIAVELYSNNAMDVFQRENRDFCSSLRDLSLLLVANLSTFLGASAAAREIFRATDQLTVDDSVSWDQNASSGSIIHDQRLFAGGLQNAKHEAIRYSHYVSKFSRRTFPKSFGTEVSGGPSKESNSMSSLENVCRAVVTSDFAFIESKVATCLFTALRVLWKTHPAANCFVLFSPEEAAQLDAMRLVRCGTVIGFRSLDMRTHRGFDTINRALANHFDDIRFGKVMYCDTVNRRWHVQPADGVSDVVVVPERQLAGIEDLTKRTSLFAHSAAPNSSTTLETFGLSASTGHLILCLRWCSQFYTEIQGNGSLQSSEPMLSLTVRLAELTSALLGTEFSIREEARISQPHSIHLEPDVLLARQILDLFEDPTDFSVPPANLDIPLRRREGRLKILLNLTAWKSMRSQLSFYLRVAVEELNAKSGRGSMSTSNAAQFGEYVTR